MKLLVLIAVFSGCAAHGNLVWPPSWMDAGAKNGYAAGTQCELSVCAFLGCSSDFLMVSIKKASPDVQARALLVSLNGVSTVSYLFVPFLMVAHLTF
jgi:hypothetical protein